jgi:hypothetical protein
MARHPRLCRLELPLRLQKVDVKSVSRRDKSLAPPMSTLNSQESDDEEAKYDRREAGAANDRQEISGDVQGSAELLSKL